MTFYDDMQNVAKDIIREFKQGSLAIIKVTPGNGPIDAPGPSTKSRVEIDGVARGVKFKYVMNGLAVASDMQVTTHGDLPVPVDMKDMIEIDGVPFKIKQIVPRPAAGNPVAYLFIVGK